MGCSATQTAQNPVSQQYYFMHILAAGVIAIYRAKPYLFLFMQCHKFKFNRSLIFACPDDGAFPSL